MLLNPLSITPYCQDLVSKWIKLLSPFFLDPIECGIHLICELLCRGEVMQGVRRRERVVMVEICMVEEEEEVEVVVVQPARSRLVRLLRGQIYSWRGQRLLVWQLENAQFGLQPPCFTYTCSWHLKFQMLDFDWDPITSRSLKCTLLWLYRCSWKLDTGKDWTLRIGHDKCAWKYWDIEPKGLDYQCCSCWTRQ